MTNATRGAPSARPTEVHTPGTDGPTAAPAEADAVAGALAAPEKDPAAWTERFYEALRPLSPSRDMNPPAPVTAVGTT